MNRRSFQKFEMRIGEYILMYVLDVTIARAISNIILLQVDFTPKRDHKSDK